MFTAKKTTLFEVENKKTSAFASAAKKVEKREELRNQFRTLSGNGSEKLSSTGNDFVDDFASATNFKSPRDYQSVAQTMENLWKQSKVLAIKLAFYMRLITRTIRFQDGGITSAVQRGQGLKNEGILRMLWIAINHEDVFWQNINLWISTGSWKDIIQMMSLDLQYHGWNNKVLNWDRFGKLILAGLENPNSNQLLLKYLPQIKSNSNCRTLEAQADNIIAKFICNLLYGSSSEEKQKRQNYKSYRKLKSSGTAHQWQQSISQSKFFEIDFDTIHGRALAQLVSSKFLENNYLEDIYNAWIESKSVAKYTGYVYELMAPVKKGYNNINIKRYQKTTINKQFYGMIETAKSNMNRESRAIVVLDTSSSMTSQCKGTKVSAYDVGKSLALYFSYLLEGHFSKCYLEFNDICKLIEWKGSNPVENLQNDRSEAYGSTNFQSVAELFCKIKKQNPVMLESEFPNTIICISDGEFNRCDKYSNFSNLKKILKEGGFSDKFVEDFKVILWDVPNDFYGHSNRKKFEDLADTPNLMHISGLDGSVISFITGEKNQTKPTPKTSEELFEAAMDQEILNMISI